MKSFRIVPARVALAASLVLFVPQLHADDGRRGGGEPNLKILGGGDAGTNEFPYMAGILDHAEPDPNSAFFCGATILHPRWAVTAAHCVVDETPSSIDVLVGARDLAQPGPAQRIPVADIVVFPGYDRQTSDGDIALLLLSQPVTVIGTFAKPARDPATFAPGVLGTVLGWGATTEAEDVYPTILQKVGLPIVSRATAQPFYDLDGIILTDNMLFAGVAAGGKNSCAGDSGGPLLVPNGSGGYLLAGIVSFGRNLPCGAPNNYGGHTLVANYAPWIDSVIAPNRAAWEMKFGAAADSSDSDADAATGFLEFASDTDPRSGSSLPFSRVDMVESTGVVYSSFTFHRLVPPSEVDYRFDFSDSLAAWSPQDVSALQVGAPLPVPGSPNMERITVRAPFPISSTPRGFFRLRATPGGSYVPSIRELPFPGFVTGGLSVLDPPVGAPATTYGKRFRITGAAPGQLVGISLRSSQFDASLAVVNESTGALVIEDTGNSGGGTDDLLSFTPVAGESYLARVNSGNAFGTGDFTLAAFPPYSHLPVISGPGDTNGTLALTDRPDPLFLPDIYYSDDYQLTNVPVGTHVVLKMSSTAFDSYLETVNAETGLLHRFDDDSAGAGSVDSYLNFIVGSTSPLLVRASSSLLEETGGYVLTRSIGASLAIPQTLNEALTTSDSLDPTYNQAPYYKDDYALPTLAVNQTVSITVASSNIDLYLILVDGVTGDLLQEVDFEGFGAQETMTFLREAGQYLLFRVSSFDPQETGNYTITTSMQ